jgi:signal transduction histidine kinase
VHHEESSDRPPSATNQQLQVGNPFDHSPQLVWGNGPYYERRIGLFAQLTRGFTLKRRILAHTAGYRRRELGVIMPSPVSTSSEKHDLNQKVLELERDLAEALQQQKAISEVLEVINSSPGNPTPAFDAMLNNATRLCQADCGILWTYKDERFRPAALRGTPPAFVEFAREPLDRDASAALTEILYGAKFVHVADLSASEDYRAGSPLRRAIVDLGGARTGLAVALRKDDALLGIFVIYRKEVRPFTGREIDLLKSFASQAVIAIENTRLLEGKQAQSRELAEALQQQTAIANVVKVINRSPPQVQPVLDAIAETAAQLCQAEYAFIWKLEGSLFGLTAANNVAPEYVRWTVDHPPGLDRGSATARAAVERATIHIPDVLADPEYSRWDSQMLRKYRSVLAVPLLRDRLPIGVVTLVRSEVKPFNDRQIELVTTFANQAMIAIENARLFEEVQARNRDLTALGEVGRAVSSTLDLKVMLKTIVDRAVELSGTDGGSIFYFRKDIGRFELGETSGIDEEVVAKFRKLDIAAGQSGLGEAITNGKPLQVADMAKRQSNPLRDASIGAGLRAALIVPLLSAQTPLGALVLQRSQPGEFPPAMVNLMRAFADQSTIALENARLFDEIAQQSRELEIASQHKSQFVANMSHELRTPLAAMLGYAELLQEGIYGTLPEKSLPILARIRSNGKHLLGLINTVLDISKIEAGQFKLNLGEYALCSIVDTVMVATESLAATKKLAFRTEVAKGLPYGLGDELRLTQVLLNLVGNAIKFTDAGEVCITGSAQNGHFALSVSDTGPGIPPEECERIFEKFRQVDSSNTRAKGGTGLGLAITREIVEMHGGRIWVESMLGQGSTFRMELPVRAVAAAGVE